MLDLDHRGACLMESQPPTQTGGHSVDPDPNGNSDVSRTPYDLDRAAMAGGFEDDMDTGREVALRLHTILKRRTDNSESIDTKDIRTEFFHDVADLWEGDPCGNSMWLAAMSNTFNAMLSDLSAQVREARGLLR
jgi:hypothetical protein